MTRFGLDTNVLLAWLFNEGVETELKDNRYRISYVVLAETIWVLRSSFRLSREQLSNAITKISSNDAFEFDDKSTVLSALGDFEKGQADFPDYLLMRDNQHAGCTATLTKDKKAARHTGFQLLEG
ncbi:MAG: twitching motility protein PilT [Pseudomonadota bacterium]